MNTQGKRMLGAVKKVCKWGRRGVIALAADRHWRHLGIQPTWVGSPSGGAYVDLRYLNKNSVVYSFGIATEISFDRAIIKETNCRVWGYDPDIRSQQWLEQPSVFVPDRFGFQALGIASCSGKQAFYVADIERMTGSLVKGDGLEEVQAEFLSLADMMKANEHTWVDYVKLDIEGAEYDVMRSWLDQYENLPIGQLWVEFHPRGLPNNEQASKRLVQELCSAGLVPAYRNYFRYPNNYLLVNRKLVCD